MKVLQINAVYEKYSTGRTTKEMHHYFNTHGVESYYATTSKTDEECGYTIGNTIDYKCHALLSRITGLQAHFSSIETKKLLKYMENLQPDVVILRNLHSNYINFPMLMHFLKIKCIPVVFVLHDCWFFTGKCVYYHEDQCNGWRQKCGNCPALKKGNISMFFDTSRRMLLEKKRFYEEYTRFSVIGVSNWVTNDAKQSIMKNANTIRTIYNWIDLNVFAPQNKEELKAELGFKGKFVILGVAAQWSEAKGFSFFKKIAEHLDDEHQIVLVGNTDINEIRKNIIFTGPILDSRLLAKYYAMSDVFLNPSIQETFGKTTAEAMACGTPVIAYNGTATPELVGKDNSCGFLIDTLSPDHFVQKIKEIESKGVDYYSMNCRKRAEKLFDINKNMSSYMEVIEELTKKP